MEAIKVCRICLAVDVKMFDLQEQPLEIYFEQIIGAHNMSMMELPPFACFECAALVKKFYYFRKRCLQGESTLFEILYSNGKITKEDIQKVDRTGLHIASNCTVHAVTQEKVIYYNHDEDSDSEIKKEPTTEDKFKIEDSDGLGFLGDPPSLVNTDNDSLSSHESIKVKKTKNKVKGKSTKRMKFEKKFKIEVSDEDEEFFEDLPSLSSSDDAISVSSCDTIILKKTKKPEKKKAKTVKALKLDEKSDVTEPLDNAEPVTSGKTIVSTKSTELVKQKPKRVRSRKPVNRKSTAKQKPRRTVGPEEDLVDKTNLEEFVTTIKLSVNEQLEEINKRQQSLNYKHAPYQCNLCYKGFINTDAWDKHARKHDPSIGSIECKICKFRFKIHRDLRQHITRHHLIKYACKSCSYISTSTNQARRHEKWHRGITYTCQYCSEVSTKWTSHLSHVRIKHPSEFICGVCGYSFVSELGLRQHKAMMHKDLADKNESDESKETTPYCEICEIKFISAEAFNRHMVTSAKHTKLNTFGKGCRICGEWFKSAEELVTHHRKGHPDRRPTNYYKKYSVINNMTWPTKCEHCSEVILNGRDYWLHFRRVHPDKKYPVIKNYICDICGKCFTNNTLLVYHKRTHLDEKAFKCSTCGKAFHTKGSLHLHQKTHSNERPYSCTECARSYKCKAAFSKHIRINHRGVKPHQCDICGKAFGESSALKVHVMTVHYKQPYQPYIRRIRLKRTHKTNTQKEEPQH